MTFVAEIISAFAPKLAPFCGYGFAASFLILQADSTWSDAWKIIMSVLLGVLVTLAGIIKRNMDEATKANALAIAETNKIVNSRLDVSIHEVNKKLDILARKQERTVGMIMIQAAYVSGGDPEKMIEAIKSFVETD